MDSVLVIIERILNHKIGLPTDVLAAEKADVVITTTIEINGAVNGNELPNNTRLLTSGEIAFLQDVFGNNPSLFSSIRIKQGQGLLSFFTGDAKTIGNVIRYKSDTYSDDFSAESLALQSLLVHEVVHVWQHQYVPRYNSVKALREHMKYKAAVYDYVVDTNKDLLDYRWEQQGQIVQDYYVKKELGQNTEDLEIIIRRPTIPLP